MEREETMEKTKKIISVDELKKWIENWFYTVKYYHPYSKSNNIPIDELYDILDRMPSVNGNAEEVNN